MVRGVSALSKHIHWPWKANRRVYHSRAGFWSSIFACLIARGVHGLFWSWGNPERSNARYNYSPEGTASRSRHFTSLGGQLKCKDDQGTRNLRPQVKIRARAPLPCPSLIRGCAPPPPEPTQTRPPAFFFFTGPRAALYQKQTNQKQRIGALLLISHLGATGAGAAATRRPRGEPGSQPAPSLEGQR